MIKWPGVGKKCLESFFVSACCRSLISMFVFRLSFGAHIGICAHIGAYIGAHFGAHIGIGACIGAYIGAHTFMFCLRTC